MYIDYSPTAPSTVTMMFRICRSAFMGGGSIPKNWVSSTPVVDSGELGQNISGLE